MDFPICLLHVLYLSLSKVDHKYTFEGQKLKFKYEGKDVCFKVTKISSFEDARDGLSNEFNSLKLEHTPSLWSVVWDSQVTLRKSEVDVKDNMKVRNTLLSINKNSSFADNREFGVKRTRLQFRWRTGQAD